MTAPPRRERQNRHIAPGRTYAAGRWRASHDASKFVRRGTQERHKANRVDAYGLTTSTILARASIPPCVAGVKWAAKMASVEYLPVALLSSVSWASSRRLCGRGGSDSCTRAKGARHSSTAYTFVSPIACTRVLVTDRFRNWSLQGLHGSSAPQSS
jgi:hypothetical protein